MPGRSMSVDDPLEDFDRRVVVLEEGSKVVHVAGSGPAVIVMTEMPGISPDVARFSRWIRDAGFTVYMPSLFGRDGAVATVREDVGRHNALDKLVGWALLQRKLPLDDGVLMVSGRTSYEIVQKALCARVAVVCAVSAPSSLA